MRRVALLLSIALAATPVAAPAAPERPDCVPIPTLDDRCERWVGAWSNPDGQTGSAGNLGEDSPEDIVVRPQGDLAYVIGQSWSGASDSDDLAVAAFDTKDGTVKWTTRIGALPGAADLGSALAVSADGATLFATGAIGTGETYCGNSACSDAATFALDALTGAERWRARYEGPAGYADRGSAIAVTGDTVFVAGATQNTPAPDEFGLVDEERAYDYLVLAYRASDGAQRWVATYDGPDGKGDRATSLALGGGRVFVTGHSDGPKWDDGNTDVATLALAHSDGALAWTARFDGGDWWDLGNDIAASPDGARVYVAAQVASDRLPVFGYDPQTDMGVIAYDGATGALRWLGRHAPGGAYSTAQAVTLSPDGATVYATGLTTSPRPLSSERDISTVAYDAATGAQRWATTFSRGTYELPGDIALSPDGGRVYVSGYSVRSSAVAYGSDAVTLAYDAATGARAWTAAYNHDPGYGAFDFGWRIAVARDGRVYTMTQMYVSAVEFALQGAHYTDYEDFGVLAYDP